MNHAHTGSRPRAGCTCFFTLVGSPQQERNARLLVGSLRAFGGRLGGCPVWVLSPSDYDPDPATWRGQAEVRLLPLDVAFDAGYWFSAKVHACAQAEAYAVTGGGPEVRSLVWLAPENLIVQPPVLFDLGSSRDAPYAAAFRTVHHRNIGSPARQPLDAFWSAVYQWAGLDEAPYAIRSYVDDCEIRPYWNTHCFAVDPARGLLRTWREGFQALVADAAFQAGPCRDEWHQVFLHQAVLSALVTAELAQDEIRALPPEYSYPLHMHAQVPPAHRASALNDLVCAVYEDVLPLEDIAVHEPLRPWLEEKLR